MGEHQIKPANRLCFSPSKKVMKNDTQLLAVGFHEWCRTWGNSPDITNLNWWLAMRMRVDPKDVDLAAVLSAARATIAAEMAKRNVKQVPDELCACETGGTEPCKHDPDDENDPGIPKPGM